jgi:FtsH-binding integral membrane protein
MQYSSAGSRPLALPSSVESTVYGLFAVAMALTLVGAYLGVQFAPQLLVSGMQVMFLIAELVLIFTSRWWSRSSPLNIILFAVFPLLSGITVTPYILSVLIGYANGSAIVLNAFAATACMGLAAAVIARSGRFTLTPAFGKALIFSVIGLIVMGLLQVFIPGMRTGAFELLISGAGIVVFALFTVFDIQRIQVLSRAGGNAFMLALSLYLDIFNLFLYVLRFMTAFSGNRRG